MYNNRPMRNTKGKILKHDLQSKELPSTRIMPDPRYFGNSRVISQEELEFFREELQNRRSSNYSVILNERKPPISLLHGHQKTKSKRPKLIASDFEALLKRADGVQDAFEGKRAGTKSPK